MNTFVCLLLLLLARRDGRSAVSAQTHVQRPAGSSVLLKCPFGFDGTWKILCRADCRGDGILIQTQSDSVQNGRYSVQYERSSHAVLVGISQLTAADSGSYLCGLATLTSASYSTSSFILTVVEASPAPTDTPLTDGEEGGATTPPPRCDVMDRPGPGDQEGSGVSLHVGVSLVVFAVVLSSTAAVICWVRKTKARGSRTAGKSHGRNTQDALYENCPPGSSGALNYESLDPARRDQNQDYFNLTRRP